MNHIFPEGS